MGLLWGLLAAGGALGQEFVPAPPDFERPKDDGKSVFAVKPPGTEAAMEDPDQPSVQERLKRANLAMKQWRYQDAMDDVDHVIAQAPKNRQAWLIRTVCRMKLGRAPDDSSLGTELSTLDWALEQTPNSGFLHGIRGILLSSKGDFDRDIADLTFAIEHQSAAVPIYYHRGVARIQRREYPEALDDFHHAAEHFEARQIPAEILIGRGQCYVGCDDLDRAISEFSAAIKRSPNSHEAYQLRAEAYFQKNDLVHALADHDQLVKLQPNDFLVYVLRSFLRCRIGDHAGAAADMDRAVELKPEAPGTYFCRAALLVLIKKDGNRAVADLDRAIGLDPGFAFYYLIRGYLHAKTLKCGPAIRDVALGLCLVAQMENRLTIQLDRERGRFHFGWYWERKDLPDAANVVADNELEGRVIHMAMLQLVAAVSGPTR